ncbi:MAG: mechanosensitive ion channel [Desulfuromonas thiophila]|nr:mechanosensitive ion channel [Desulfuromonas thiophila]
MDFSQLLDPEKLIPRILDLIFIYGPKLIAAIFILFVGRWIARLLRLAVRRVLTRSKVDDLLVSFVCSLTYMALLAFVVIAALNQIGIQTTSFIAILGAAGLAVGLALQGSLSNFAAGVLMIIFRPFQTGDYIEGGGVAGQVQETQIFTTHLLTPDNKLVIVPNANLMSGNIVNYSANNTRRIDLTVGVSYTDDLAHVKQVLEQILAADSRILPEPNPLVAVSELADSSVNLVVRPWVATKDYWAVYYDLTETIKTRFDAAGISIPFPQQDVHLHNTAAS